MDGSRGATNALPIRKTMVSSCKNGPPERLSANRPGWEAFGDGVVAGVSLAIPVVPGCPCGKPDDRNMNRVEKRGGGHLSVG